MSRERWYNIVRETLVEHLSEQAMDDLYHRCASAYGFGQTYHYQVGGKNIDLTEMFEQYRMLAILAGESNAPEKDN